MNPIRSGQTILHYHIIEKIGRGGMGEVYKALDLKLGRQVAIKLLSPEATHDEDARRRLIREARSASALNHPNIVTIYAIEEVDGTALIVMEYVEGETLKAIVERGPLEWLRLLDLVSQVADALAAAHSLRLIHRDIKSANILITPKGLAKVLDFGLAKLIRHPSESGTEAITLTADLTAAGTIMGTVAYMSPEQMRGELLDARTDIFSLGVVLYEIATGRPPFNGPNLLSVMHQIVTVDPTAPSRIKPELPQEFDRIIERVLAKDKERRYSSASELARALRGLRDTTSESIPRFAAPDTEIRPETRYARSGDINIAYQVIGDGPIDLVYVPGWVTNVEYGWEEPLLARFYQRLASFCRLILFDKRGTGLSDQTANLPTLEQRMDDVRAVMEAVGSERAAVFGMSEGSGMSILFAATYPEHTAALIIFGSFAKRVWDPEYPWAPTLEERQKFFDAIEHEWGSPLGVEDLAPSMAHDEGFRRWWASYQRRSVSPRAALALAQMNTSIDVRHVLPAIRVPTLVLHRTGDRDSKVEEGRYVAARIPGAKYVELSGDDHLLFVGDQGAVLDEVEQFLNSIQQAPNPERVLATVLFTEAVNPMAEREMLERHRALARREIEWFRGRESYTEKDGLLATFDGPARAIRAACAIGVAALRLGIETRIGLHTGECERVSDTMRGIAVEVGSQLARKAGAGEILVSSTVKELAAGSGIQFEDRGVHALEGVPGEWRLFAVEPSQGSLNDVSHP